MEENVIIPKFVADFIEFEKSRGNTLMWVLSKHEVKEEIQIWLWGTGSDKRNEKLLFDAWYYDYTVKKEEENVIVPQFVIDYIKECKSKDFTLYGAFQYATGDFEKWIFEDHYKKIRAEIFAKAWLESDTSQKEEEK